jgi:hypothetical protein
MPDLQGEQDIHDVVLQNGVCFRERLTFAEVAKAGSPMHENRDILRLSGGIVQ